MCLKAFTEECGGLIFTPGKGVVSTSWQQSPVKAQHQIPQSKMSNKIPQKLKGRNWQMNWRDKEQGGTKRDPVQWGTHWTAPKRYVDLKRRMLLHCHGATVTNRLRWGRDFTGISIKSQQALWRTIKSVLWCLQKHCRWNSQRGKNPNAAT